MKNLLTIIYCLFFVSNISGQWAAQKYLAQLPPLPHDICSVSDVEEDNYKNSIISVTDAIDTEIERIEKQLPTQNQMMESVSKTTGISQEKLNAIKNSENEEEGKELAEQKMLTEYGISMEDVAKMEQMSEEEQQQWAKSYANNHTKSATEIQKQNKDKATVSKSAQIEKLNQEILAYHTKWAKMTLELAKQEGLAKKDLETCLEKVKNGCPKPKYQGEHCVNGKAIEEYLAKNEPPCHQAYCNRISPLKIQTLNQKKGDCQKMFSLLTQLQTLQNNIQESQTGIDLNASREVAALTLVKDYAKEMYDIF